MKRALENELLAWKSAQGRMPLLLRGARQTGKTYLVREFAKQHFGNLLEINFELNPEFKKVFETLEPDQILKQLGLLSPVEIIPEQTLFFFDEIQSCPRALMALRYFYEKRPDLHVMGAGSLLDFCLSDKELRMPVGRVQYLYLQPLSFKEFLLALGELSLKKYLEEISLREKPSEPVHQKLCKILKDYLITGGMPAVVNQYLQDPLSKNYQNQQTLLLQTYRDDFGKYSSQARRFYLESVFASAPRLVGQRYKYSHVDPESQSRDLKEALALLERAGVLYRVPTVSGHGLPFQINDKKFKILFLDVGLMQRGCGLDAEIVAEDDFLAINRGALAEQFVGQELLVSLNPYEDRRLFFWARDSKNSQAEVDYVVVNQGKIIPIEVKSGKTGTLKSLHLFLKEYHSPLGLRLSGQPLSYHDQILSIPLYAVSEIFRLTETVRATL